MKNAQIIIFCIMVTCIICTVLIGILIYFMNKGEDEKTSIVRFTSADDEIRYIQSDSPIYSNHLSEPKEEPIQDFSTSRSISADSDKQKILGYGEFQKKKNEEPKVQIKIQEEPSSSDSSVIIINMDSLRNQKEFVPRF